MVVGRPPRPDAGAFAAVCLTSRALVFDVVAHATTGPGALTRWPTALH